MTQSTSSFSELGLTQPILDALADVGYESPSPIQAACIPPLLAGRDLLGEAQTGTGKTAAFALPTLARVDLELRSPQVLVLTPTRELAIQVAEAYRRYARQLENFQVLPIYGGQSIIVQLRQLDRGAHVIVGTPGRILDHLERGSLVLDQLRTVVLDEADEMLRMGFIDDVEDIIEQLPSNRQTALFSATIPDPIRFVAHQYMREPEEVRIEAATATVAAITQRYWQARGVDKLEALTRILEIEDDLDAAIVFVRTKVAAEELADKLAARGYAAAALQGDMPQGMRERVIEQLKAENLDIIVATDVAARGIDVQRVTHVINYDMPYDVESYVHRIGRTGRAGKKGNAILFVTPREVRMLRAIERATRQPMELLNLPSREAVADRRVAQFKEQLIEVAESEDLSFFREIVRELELEQDLAPSEVAAALAWMVQRERPLQAEESAFDDRTAPPSRKNDKGAKPRKKENRDDILEKRRSFAGGALQRYRIEVGRNQGASPKEIVGAIANEGGIEGRHIGQIHLFADYSTVELPASLPRDILELLQHTRVRQCPLHIRPYSDGELPDNGKPRRNKRPAKNANTNAKGGNPAQQQPQGKSAKPPGPNREKRRGRKGGTGEATPTSTSPTAEASVSAAPAAPAPVAAAPAPTPAPTPVAEPAPAPTATSSATPTEAPEKPARKSAAPRKPRAPRKTAAAAETPPASSSEE